MVVLGPPSKVAALAVDSQPHSKFIVLYNILSLSLDRMSQSAFLLTLEHHRHCVDDIVDLYINLTDTIKHWGFGVLGFWGFGVMG